MQATATTANDDAALGLGSFVFALAVDVLGLRVELNDAKLKFGHRIDVGALALHAQSTLVPRNSTQRRAATPPAAGPSSSSIDLVGERQSCLSVTLSVASLEVSDTSANVLVGQELVRCFVVSF